MNEFLSLFHFKHKSEHHVKNDDTTLQLLLENMYTKKTQHRFSLIYLSGVTFEYILKVIPQLLSDKVQHSYYVMQPHFPQVGLGILCPILYTIFCGHTCM